MRDKAWTTEDTVRVAYGLTWPGTVVGRTDDMYDSCPHSTAAIMNR